MNFGVLYLLVHPSVHKAGEIEVWTAIEVELIANHVSNAVGWSSILGNDVLGELREGVLARVWSQV